MSDLVKRVEVTIEKRRLIRRREAVLVAVSGGLDSMVLLGVLVELAEKRGWRLTVAHFNHRLRGRSSDADERLVRSRAKKLGLAFVDGSGDVKEYARARGISVEMGARKLRHAFLAKVAAKRGIKTIALAHHADDQVELFFLRLLRGAGSEGLAGMKWRAPSSTDAGIDLVRPLLEVTKGELEAYAKAHGIKFREDASNAQLDMQRNRIRRELLPMLRENYQPALNRVILREMETLGAEAEFIDRAAQDWLKGKRREGFGKLPVAVQRRCVQVQLPGLGVVGNFDLIEELREEGKLVSVSEGVGVYRGKWGKIHARKTDGAGRFWGRKKVNLRGKMKALVFAGTRVTWESVKADSGTFRAVKTVANTEYFDANKVGSMIFLRHWRPGDRFQPIGMETAAKLQDLFVNRKVPRAERHGLIVATTAQGQIFWVEGLRMAEQFKLDTTTRRGLKWCWQRV